MYLCCLKPPENARGCFPCLSDCLRAKHSELFTARSSPFGPGKAPSTSVCGWPGDAAVLAGKDFPFQLLLPSGEIKGRGLDQLVELKNVKLVSDELSNRFSKR